MCVSSNQICKTNREKTGAQVRACLPKVQIKRKFSRIRVKELSYLIMYILGNYSSLFAQNVSVGLG